MKKEHWFVPKRFGWGVVPVSWQGWAATAALVVGLLLGAYFILPPKPQEPTAVQLGLYIAYVAGLALLFIAWAKPHTKGSIVFRWGTWYGPAIED